MARSERMHADMQNEIRSRQADTRALQQVICDEWRVDFNHVRPHEALAMQTPSDIYRPSPRRARTQTGALRSGCERRTVDDRGWLSWNQQRVYVTTALRGHTVGLTRDEVVVIVWFHHLRLGTFDVGTGASVQPPPPPMRAAKVSPGDTPDPSHP